MIYNVLNHLKTILIHKYWVAKYCFQLKLYWRGLTHDLSKFHPIEFFESVQYYTGKNSPINECKKNKGYSLAWQHHKGCNSHHYEYWIDHLDTGGDPIKMPKDDLKELICDWIGAGKTYMGSDFTFKKEADYVWNRIKFAKIHKDTFNAINCIFVLLYQSNMPFSNIVNIVLKDY